MKLRLAAVGAAVGVAALLAPADAGVIVMVEDKKGDATAADQDLCVDASTCAPRDVAGPWSQPGFDIVSLTFGSTFQGSTPKELVVTLTYAGKPDETSTVHRVTADDANGCGTFMIQYYAEQQATGGKASALRTCDESAALGYSDKELPLPKVTENSIVWNIPYTFLKGLNVPLKPGNVISGLGAHNRLAHAATVPVVDSVVSDKTYKLGS